MTGFEPNPVEAEVEAETMPRKKIKPEKTETQLEPKFMSAQT